MSCWYVSAGLRRFAACIVVLGCVWSVSLKAQQTHLLVIVGLGGDPAFTEQFHDWGQPNWCRHRALWCAE